MRTNNARANEGKKTAARKGSNFLKAPIWPMREPRLPVRELPYKKREQLAIRWALDRGYPVPNKPGCLLIVAGVIGLALAVIPGILCLWLASKKQNEYERDMRELMMRWADAWEDARLDEIEDYRYFIRQQREKRLLQAEDEYYEDYEEYEEIDEPESRHDQ